MSQRLFADDVLFLQRLLKSGGLYQGALDGDWGPLTDAAFNAFVEQTDEIASNLGRFDSRTERAIATLQLPTQRAARRFLKRVRDESLDARIISGTRSYKEQTQLFRQGRFGNPGPRVTNARGGKSNHNFGLAWDIGLFQEGAYLSDSPLYERAQEIGLDEEIEWGGHWTRFPDRPHYQLAVGLPVAEIRARFETGQPYF